MSYAMRRFLFWLYWAACAGCLLVIRHVYLGTGSRGWIIWLAILAVVWAVAVNILGKALLRAEDDR
ncbi:MAG: hypothetical protein J2P50_18370 [Hyphomicrobiaceae bacterium]|nr:hypothetical protein [Hyphomicrobiaceae bacterium]